MPRHVVVTTPENVKIEYELAGAASRGAAVLIDTLLQGGLIALIFFIWYLLGEAGLKVGASVGMAIIIIALFLVFWGYYVFFETVWNGQTPGKRYLGLRAIREGGLPIDLSCAAIRNLVRIIDFLPQFYIVGIISILCARNSKRLGDLAAGTLVVKERKEWIGGAGAKPQVPPLGQVARIPGIEMITSEEFDTVRRFIERRNELDARFREEVAAKIARPIVERLGIQTVPGVLYSNLLNDIYTACIRDRGMR